MKLSYKNTEYKLKINLTNNKIGLLNNDVWCNVILNITNKEFNYQINRQSLSKNELEKIIKTIKESYYNKEKVPKLLFIKNYFTIKCYNTNTDKYMDLKIIKPEETKYKNYKIIFKNNEILEFLNIIEQPIISIEKILVDKKTN